LTDEQIEGKSQNVSFTNTGDVCYLKALTYLESRTFSSVPWKSW